MLLKRLAIPTCLALLAFPTPAQQAPTTVTKDPQAVTVLNQVIGAAGGVTAISAIVDVIGTGNITYSQPSTLQGTLTVRGRGMNQFRLDATLPAGVRSQAISQGQVSATAVDGTAVQINAQAPACPSCLVLPYLLMVPALNSPWFNLSYKGIVQLDGRSVHDISVQEVIPGLPDPSGVFAEYHTVDFFIDASTFQVSMFQDTVPNHLLRQIRFSNYQTVNGILAPFSFTEQSGGLQTWSIQLTNITFNTGLQDSDFQL